MKRFIAALGMLAMLFTASAAAADDTSIKGVVRDSVTGRVIAGATVVDGSKTATTNYEGKFRLSNVSPGSNTLTVSKTGYATLTKIVFAQREETTEVNINLVKQEAPICTYTYSEWGTCQPAGVQTRTVISSSPDGCVGEPILSTTCVYVPPVCEYVYTDWNACQHDNTQTRTVISVGPDGCIGDAVTTQACVFVPPVCTDFTYTDWSVCSNDGVQTRAVVTAAPEWCQGGNPVLAQSCIPLCQSYTYTDWNTCQPDGTQTRTVTSKFPATCEGGVAPVTTQTCTYVPPVCTSWTYSAWGACQPNGTQTRTVLTSSPTGCAGGSPVVTQTCTYVPPVAVPGTSWRVFANNDLGMHCVDSSFAVFSILPPYNVVDAQVVARQSSGRPIVLNQSQVDVRYSAVADPNGSINGSGAGKSDFYQFVEQLYGAKLQVGQGLEGMWMPAQSPDLAGTTLIWDTKMGLFKAPGIPIFPIDDAGGINSYPLMKFSAYDKSGRLLASTDTVLPVSDETSCQTCHQTGQVAAMPGSGIQWSTTVDPEPNARQNIIILHNAKNGTNLVAPVLCATCHYSPALDLGGNGQTPEQAKHGTMSNVMHAFHADKMTGFVDSPVPVGGTPPNPALLSCYTCHPGASTKCLRGAMTSKESCQNCHGNMAAVGGKYPLLPGGSIDGTNDGGSRRPWQDLPKCSSCHANDAVVKTNVTSPPPLATDGLRFANAFKNNDPSASPIVSQNPRFTEETGKLFRKSKGHGGMACQACHGSTHAIWPGDPGSNDNVAPVALQGHTGTIGECSTCHQAAPSAGLGGPHGMHPVGSAWVTAHHEDQWSSGAILAQCRACHGADYRGTVLSKMFATRTMAGRTFQAGTVIGCYSCHNGPNP